MDLGPIGGFLPVSALEPKVNEIELTAVSKMDGSSRPGKYSSSRRQASGRQDVENSDAAVEEVPADASSPADESTSGGNISFFA